MRSKRYLVGSFFLVVVAALVLACGSKDDASVLPQGERLSGASPESVLDSNFCATPRPGKSPLRRLSNQEYRNSLLAYGFLAEDVDPLIELLPSEAESLGFRNGASALVVNSLLADKYNQISSRLVHPEQDVCDATEKECRDRFIESAGLLLHRRPLSPEEVAAYASIYELSREHDDAPTARQWVVRAMLQSPHFLYRVEVPEEKVKAVTGYEMASRLSYTFWQAPPDQELLQAAAAGELTTRTQILEQALRLIADERAYRLYDFFEQWLDLDELNQLDRDPTLYPDLDPALPQLLRAESRAFIQQLLSDPASTYADLVGAKYTYANAKLAAHYGISGPSADAFERVETPERSGVLTQGMLAVRDASTHSSIVRRGLKIRTDFLCQIVPAPPANVDLSLDGIGADLTQAERLELHRASPACNKCHSLMDPIGVAFEQVDAVGRMRVVDEYQNPIPQGGEITGTRDADGPVANVGAVAAQLSSSQEAAECYMLQHFRYFFGRQESREDLCTQAQLSSVFEKGQHSLIELLVGIAQTDAFLYQAALVSEPEAGGAGQ